MLLSDLLSIDRVMPDVRANSKKRLLEVISEELVRNDESLNGREIFESLCARERLGSTGLGNGVAIPHGRVSHNPTVQAIFVKLSKPLPYDSQDGKPVDLLFAMVVPENCTSEHLKLLSQVAEKFSDPELLSKVRNAKEPAEMLELLSGTQH